MAIVAAVPVVSISPAIDGVSSFGRSGRSRLLGFGSGIAEIPLLAPSPARRSPAAAWKKRGNWTCESRSSDSCEHVPKQFREKNLKEGLTDNFKNVPDCLYGLTASQMDMFMTENSPFKRQAEKVTEESISSARSYRDDLGIYTMADMQRRPSKYSMSYSMRRGGARGYGRTRSGPPDLPSLLLASRIVYLGMPIFPAVSELLAAQFMWLDYDDPYKPIHLYINSSGTHDEKMQLVGSETDAYVIVDMMGRCHCPIYTINLNKAYGQAAVLLSLGVKGHRALLPHASTKLYLPKVNRSSGQATDMWIRAEELDVNTQSYVKLLARGLGKPKEEIEEEVKRPRFFSPQQAIDYGLADKIMKSLDAAYSPRELAGRSAAGAAPPLAPSKFR